MSYPYTARSAPVRLGDLRLPRLPTGMTAHVVEFRDRDRREQRGVQVAASPGCRSLEWTTSVPVAEADQDLTVTGGMHRCGCDDCGPIWFSFRRTGGGAFAHALGKVGTALTRFAPLARRQSGSSWRNLPQPYRARALFGHLGTYEPTFWRHRDRDHVDGAAAAWCREVIDAVVIAAEGVSLAELWAAERSAQHQLRSVLGHPVPMPDRPGPGARWVLVAAEAHPWSSVQIAADPDADPGRSFADGGPGATAVSWRSFDASGAATAALLAAHHWVDVPEGTAVLVPEQLAEVFRRALSLPGEIEDPAGVIGEVVRLVDLGSAGSAHVRGVTEALLAARA